MVEGHPPAESLWETRDDGSVAGGVVIQLKQRGCNQLVVPRYGKQRCQITGMHSV